MAECFYYRAMRTRTGLHGNAKVLYLILAGHADQEGQCWPSIKTLAAEVETGERNVIILLHQLRDAGLLAVDEAGGGRGKSNRYRLLLPAVSPESSSESIPETQQYTDPQITDLQAKPRSPDQRSAEPETLINPAETVIKRPETVIPGSPEQPLEDPQEQKENDVRTPWQSPPWLHAWNTHKKKPPKAADLLYFRQNTEILGRELTEAEWDACFLEAYTTPNVRSQIGWMWGKLISTGEVPTTPEPADDGKRLRDEQAARTQRGFDGATPPRRYSGLDAPPQIKFVPAERPVRRLA